MDIMKMNDKWFSYVWNELSDSDLVTPSNYTVGQKLIFQEWNSDLDKALPRQMIVKIISKEEGDSVDLHHISKKYIYTIEEKIKLDSLPT